MKIVSFYNVKGGVGKTSLAILISLELQKRGKRVLIIDADTQANLTQQLYKVFHNDKTIIDGLANNLPVEDLIVKSPIPEYKGVDLIPSDLSLSIVNELLALKTGRETVVGRWMAASQEYLMKNYDVVIVDLSPAYELIVRNFMILSDTVICPLGYEDISSIRGCELFDKKIKQDLDDLGIPETNRPKRVVVMNYHTTRKLASANDFLEVLDHYPDVKRDLLDSKISNSTAITRSVKTKMDVETYCKKVSKKPHHRNVLEMQNLVDELISKEVF